MCVSNGYIFILLAVISGIKLCSGIQLTAYISESGLHGEVIFQQQSGNGSSIIIRTELQATDEQSQWTWTVRDLPVFYTDIENRCSDEKLGPVTLNLDEKFGPLELPTNGSVEFTSSNNEIMLTGSKGLWGKSILFEMVDDRTRRACATITVSGNADEKIAEARFLSPIAGSVFMHKSRENCNFLQLVFDPVFSTPPGQAVGDLDTRLGKVKVAGDPRKQMPSAMGVYHDEGLTSLSVDLLSGQRSLYLVIFDSRHHDSFLACAKIREIHPAVLKSVIQKDGVTGDVTLIQRSPFDPTWIRMNLTSTRDSLTGSTSTVTSYKIQELPPLPYTPANENPCQKTGSVFNPSNIEEEQASGSQETYAIGDLSGKHNMWQQEQTFDDLNGQRWDIFLPLYGPHSVAHRSVVFYRQPRDQPWADTTVIVEMLVHSDGTSLNNTADHRWAVHLDPRGKDYYNWTGRCLSAGPIFNPYKIPFNNSETDSLCGTHRPGYCRLGDLSTRLGTLSIAGRKKNAEKLTRRLFTDQLLPLSGSASIMGRTLVLYDDNGPKARGERLACSIIYGIYRRKAVIKDWYGNGIPTTLKGKIELFQQTEYDVTDIEVDLEGLVDNSGYHIHVAPVQEQLEFPCEGSSLYGHWNPYNVNPSLSPPASKGTSDQYEMGDLSGKFGLLDNLISLDATYNDTRLPLFGTNAVLGRSVIIHKKDKNMRWVCSSIERGYAPGEARELRAIASFHHPLGYAYGYIRMTRNHHWAIYVNPVGVDATVKIQNTRCVAGGYRWNPFYTQLADPLNDELYREECGPDNPLRCYVGDVSGRLGTINLGDKRQVFTDSNFPLEGDVSAMGRSIVIFDKEGGGDRFACANIEPDKDIIKYANIRKPPRFVVAQFIEDVREVMGLPEWMLTVDSRKTRTLHGGTCIQFLLHFKGAQANQLEQDFSRLLANGFLGSLSLYNPGYVPSVKRKTHLSYRPCGTRDPNEKNTRTSVNNASSLTPMPSILCSLILIIIIYLQNT
ncbi:hypothetical protein C0J52_15463 [Blattella germanica]|nr:hypothetical protein C0J52_15463 [Blattella germanica]